MPESVVPPEEYLNLIEVLATTMRSQQKMANLITEEFGALVALMEDVLPVTAETTAQMAEVRGWLIDIKRADVDMATLLEAADELVGGMRMVHEVLGRKHKDTDGEA